MMSVVTTKYKVCVYESAFWSNGTSVKPYHAKPARRACTISARAMRLQAGMGCGWAGRASAHRRRADGKTVVCVVQQLPLSNLQHLYLERGS